MAIVPIPITKGGASLDVDTDKLPQHVYEEALRLGLKDLLARGMSKITKADIPDEATRKAEAMLKAEENLKKVYAGEIRITGQKAAGKVSGAVKTEAMRLARNIIKAEMKKVGIKVSHVAAKDITAAANQLLSEDDGGILKQAEENLKARAEAPVKIDVKALIKTSPDLVAKAEARKAKAKADKGETLSATQAGKVATRKRGGAQATA